jgi:formylglycine-generating enzyme required for sulfatase activity
MSASQQFYRLSQPAILAGTALIPPGSFTMGDTLDYTNGDVAPFVNWAANGYRLPTEAEREKAARGGLSGQRFPWGNTISESQANYFGDTAAYSYDLAGFDRIRSD